MEMSSSKVSKFSVSYAAMTGVYYLFDFVYMPWLTIKYGYKVFIPLYPSILIVNLAGLYAYNLLGEDLLFIDFGKTWLSIDSGKFDRVKKIIRSNQKLTFIFLSIWPSPIAGYLFLRQSAQEPFSKVFKATAIGSIFCAAFWGGGLSLVYFIATRFITIT